VKFARKKKLQGEKNQKPEPPAPLTKEIDLSEITIPVQLFFKIKDTIDEGNIPQLKNELDNLRDIGEDGVFLNKKLIPLVEKNELEGVLTILEKVKIMGKGHD